MAGSTNFKFQKGPSIQTKKKHSPSFALPLLRVALHMFFDTNFTLRVDKLEGAIAPTLPCSPNIEKDLSLPRTGATGVLDSRPTP